MGKVPVGRTISAAYGFLGLRPGSVIGLGWLPAAFYAAAIWFCLYRLGHAMELATPSSAAFNEFTSIDFLGLLVASAVLIPTAAVPFARIALGKPHEPAVAHFVYGKREFRLSLALMGFYLLTIAVLVGLALLAQFAIGVGLPRPGEPMSGFSMPVEWVGVPLVLWLNGAAGLVLAIAALFLSARLGFYLPALAAADEHVTLGRAWTLSRKNFWRLAMVHLALAVPVALVFAGAIYLVEGDTLGPVLRTAWAGIPSEGMSALYRLQYEHAGALAGIWAVGMVAVSALYAGAASAAYRTAALGEEAPAPQPFMRPAPTIRTEPDLEPAWAAAKAMADANRQQPVAQHVIAERASDYALASEAAATTEAHIVAQPMEAPAPETPHEMTAAEAVHSALAQVPGYVGEGAWPEAEATEEVHAASEPAATESAAPPLDPAGAAAVVAAREDAARAES